MISLVAFAEKVKPTDDYFEKILSYAIHVDGNLASVWTPYEFYNNQESLVIVAPILFSFLTITAIGKLSIWLIHVEKTMRVNHLRNRPLSKTEL